MNFSFRTSWQTNNSGLEFSSSLLLLEVIDLLTCHRRPGVKFQDCADATEADEFRGQVVRDGH